MHAQKLSPKRPNAQILLMFEQYGYHLFIFEEQIFNRQQVQQPQQEDELFKETHHRKLKGRKSRLPTLRHS